MCVECGDDCPEVELPDMEKPDHEDEDKPMCDDENEDCEEKPEKPMCDESDETDDCDYEEKPDHDDEKPMCEEGEDCEEKPDGEKPDMEEMPDVFGDDGKWNKDSFQKMITPVNFFFWILNPRADVLLLSA